MIWGIDIETCINEESLTTRVVMMSVVHWVLESAGNLTALGKGSTNVITIKVMMIRWHSMIQYECLNDT